jgi:heme/copper-type cytochrome/quinol oxidase subunit 3
MPMPGWPPLMAAVFTAAFFLLLTVKWVAVAAVCGVLAIGGMIRWAWELDTGPKLAPVEIGGGIRLPVYASGPLSQSWWAAIILILVAGATYTCLVFSYLYFWTVKPELWPAPGLLPALRNPVTAAACLILSSAAIETANRGLRRESTAVICAALATAMLLIVVAFAVEMYVHRELDPSGSSYGATVQTVVALGATCALVVTVFALFALARRLAGLLDRERRNVLDNTRLLWHYTVAQSLVSLALIHGFPRWVA